MAMRLKEISEEICKKWNDRFEQLNFRVDLDYQLDVMSWQVIGLVKIGEASDGMTFSIYMYFDEDASEDNILKEDGIV